MLAVEHTLAEGIRKNSLVVTRGKRASTVAKAGPMAEGGEGTDPLLTQSLPQKRGEGGDELPQTRNVNSRKKRNTIHS